MKKDDIHWKLNQLVDFLYSTQDHGWSSVSIFHRIATETVVDLGTKPGHKILIPDIKPDLRKVNIAFNEVEKEEQQIIIVKYMPYEIEGRKTLDRDRARFMGISPSKFSRLYSKSVKNIKKIIRGLT